MRSIRRLSALLLALVLVCGLIPTALAEGPAGDLAIDETNFPDENFRSFVSAQYDADHNGALSDAERNAVQVIDCQSKNIQSLRGVEFFPALTELRCSNNQLTGLELSQNTALRRLYCYGNQLTSLDVSQNTLLEYLHCYDNQLTGLELRQNTALKNLQCFKNPLKSLDVSQNTALVLLHCFKNQLTSLDLSHNTALKNLWCYENQLTSLDLSPNTALEYLDCHGNQLTSLNLSQNTALYSLNCEENQLTSLDLGPNHELENLICRKNQLTSLDLSQATALTYLWCSGNQLASLDLEKNTALNLVHCYRNQLTSLNLDQNTALVYLRCDQNQLTSLDLSPNTALEDLDCSNNQLTSLDLSQNAAITELYCYGNPLTSLDLRPMPALNYTVGYYLWKQKTPGILANGNCPCYIGERGRLAVDADVELIVNVTPFTDVKEGKYYYEPVYWAYYWNPQITDGSGPNEFGPGNPCTREQIVTFLWKAAGAPEPTTSYNPFTDVKRDKYYYKAVLWAREKHITEGVSQTSFGVGQPCTRAQAMTFLWIAKGSPEPVSTENPFTDVKEGKYYYKAVLWAVENEITAGVDQNLFGVGQTCTRGQIVTFLYKLYK